MTYLQVKFDIAAIRRYKAALERHPRRFWRSAMNLCGSFKGKFQRRMSALTI